MIFGRKKRYLLGISDKVCKTILALESKGQDMRLRYELWKVLIDTRAVLRFSQKENKTANEALDLKTC